MYVDNFLTITNPNLTTAGNYFSASIDLGVGRDIAEGTELRLVVTRTGSFTGDAATTCAVNLWTADGPSTASTGAAGAGGSAGSSPVQLSAGQAIALAAATSLGIPVQTIIPMPAARNASGLEAPGALYRRYLYVVFAVAAGTGYTGSNSSLYNVQIVIDAQDGVTYHADAIATLPNPV
jgi:hypothetical protein